MSPAPNLAGRAAIVTAPARGIGKAIALALAGAGADLMLAGRDPDGMAATHAEIRALGRRAPMQRCDVTNAEEIAAMVGEASAVFGRIDILVNVAGGTAGATAPVWDTPAATFREILRLNLESAFLTMSAVLPQMIARRSGRIVNIGGTYGLRGRAGRAAYSAAKWGLRGLTKSTALEAAPHGITVNCICPGMVEGGRFEEAAADLARRDDIPLDEAAVRIVRGFPSGRVSTPQDIAAAVLFLVGDGARQITGQDLAVDGGWTV